MKTRPRRLTLLLFPLCLAAGPAGACLAGDVVVLFDSCGFEDAQVYPPGDLRSVAHGEGRWTPATGTARPGQIVDLDDGGHGRVLRRYQTGQQAIDADLLDFPPTAGTQLTIAFDARVSSARSRTLDLFLLRPGETDVRHQASVLIWGQNPGQLSCFDGAYRDLAAIDEAWHHYEIVHDLAANTFDVKIDGRPVARALRWRNAFAPDAEFGRLRIGAIRGREGEFADVDHLRIVAAPAPPAISVIEPATARGLLDPAGAFRFRVTADRPVAESAIAVRLNGRDVSDRLAVSGTPLRREVRLGDLAPNTSYHAVVTATNERGTAERSARFYTFVDRVDGYRGIWFNLGQMSGEYGDKYAGGLAFCFGHTLIPMAVHAPEVNKTFFVYGGTTGPEDRYLLVMASYYDHARHRVPRPTIVRDQRGVNDPHDNPSLAIDDEGYLWVFVAGRARHRPGQIFRSSKPYSVAEFEEIESREQTYSQIWHVREKGFFHLLTKYTRGRELYWETSPDGRRWTEQQKLAGFQGHYQVSRLDGDKVGTAFNFHREGRPDRRTNLYYAQTTDFGRTWTTVDGRRLATPLDEVANPALIIDYEAQGLLAYIKQLVFDDDGRPVILYLTSPGYEPGPQNDPRTWKITRWTGEQWVTRPITASDHNYDMGSLYLAGDRWTLIAPTLPGGQPYHTGGEVGLWVSTDRGDTWSLQRQVTRDSPGNHCYLRRPHEPADPFFAVWADGDSSRLSTSRLFFTNSTGDRLYMLPYTMEDDEAEPTLLDPPSPPAFQGPAREKTD